MRAALFDRMGDALAPFGLGMVNAGVAEDPQLPVPRRCESEARVVAQFVAILGEMNLGAAVAVGFGVKIAVFYIRTHA